MELFETLFSRVRVERRKRNFSKTLKTHYQFQSTPRNVKNLLKMADGRFPFLSFMLRLISSFQANLALLIPQADYSRRRQNRLSGYFRYRCQEAEGWISLYFDFVDFEERHNKNINPHQRNSMMAPIYYFAGS